MRYGSGNFIRLFASSSSPPPSSSLPSVSLLTHTELKSNSQTHLRHFISLYVFHAKNDSSHHDQQSTRYFSGPPWPGLIWISKQAPQLACHHQLFTQDRIRVLQVWGLKSSWGNWYPCQFSILHAYSHEYYVFYCAHLFSSDQLKLRITIIYNLCISLYYYITFYWERKARAKLSSARFSLRWIAVDFGLDHLFLTLSFTIFIIIRIMIMTRV